MSRPISSAYPYGFPLSAVVADSAVTPRVAADFQPQITRVSDAMCDILGDTGWTKLTPIAPWVVFGAPFASIMVRRRGQHVTVRGLVKTGTSGTIFQLPSGYRPGANELFTTVCSAGIAAIQVVAATGFVVLNNVSSGGSTAGFMSLDAISFFTD